jgi:uncharacterized protein YbjT (DUF2867 family)
MKNTNAKAPANAGQKGTIAVTGSTGGMGRLLVKRLREAGFQVHACARSLDATAFHGDRAIHSAATAHR